MTNNEIKFIRSLQQRKFREENGLFVVEGEKMVAEAVKSGWKVEKIIRKDDVGDETMGRISSMTSPSPVLAVVEMKKFAADAIPSKGLAVALDAVRDPGNMGTIIRIADWFGVSTVFASKDSAELYNQKVINASMGSIFRVNVQYVDLEKVCDEYKAAAVPVYGTFLGGENIYDACFPESALLIMGNEANGISAAVERKVDSKLTIPSFGSKAESLNVAVATAVCVSEFKRRFNL